MYDYDSYDSDEFDITSSASSSAQTSNHPPASDYFGGTTVHLNADQPSTIPPFAGRGIGRGAPSGRGEKKPGSDCGQGFKGNFSQGYVSNFPDDNANVMSASGGSPRSQGHGARGAFANGGRGQSFGRGSIVNYQQKITRGGGNKGPGGRGRGIQSQFDSGGQNSELWQRANMSDHGQMYRNEKPPEKWISEIEWASAQKDKSGVLAILRECFSSASNPYMYVLHMVETCKDFANPKTTSTCYLILKEFSEWIDANENKAKFHKLLNENIRIEAFKIGSLGNMVLFDNTVKAYSLRHIGNAYFLPFIKSMLQWNKYKEAATCVTKLDLHEQFEAEEIMVPLLFQDKINILENYVFRKKREQERLVRLLDMLCEKGFSVTEYSKKFDIPSGNIRWEKLKYKPLSKLAVKLLKLYQIKPETCPNINNAKAMGGIRYLMFKKYTEKNISNEVFEELVESSIGDNVVLQELLVDGLVDYLDFEEAAKWAIRYHLPEDNVPHQIREAMANYTEPSAQSEFSMPDTGEDWDADCISEDLVKASYHYTLNFPREKIQWINDRAGYEKCLESITVPGVTVGIDSEWRPSFGQFTSRVSLMQLATNDEVFLLDAVELYKCLTDEDWQKFADRFFCSAHVIKLGYGIGSDFQMIVKALPCIKENMAELVRVVDLQTLSQSIMKIFPDFFVPDKKPTYVFDVGEDGTIEPHAVHGKSKREPIKHEKLKYSDLKAMQKNRGVDEYADDDDDDDSEEEATSAVTGSFQKGEEKGLSDLVRMCCGKPLDKKEQMSNWEKRPLREAQIVYASLDAFVLLEVYDVIKSISAVKGLDVNMEPNISMKWLKDKKSKREKFQEKKQLNVAELSAAEIEKKKRERRNAREKAQHPLTPVFKDPIKPKDFHVVVDNMLQGLGKQLRCCGVDVRILENTDDHDKAAAIAAREGRIILTSGSPYFTLKSAVPEGHCLNVSNTMEAKEQLVDVLDTYNVKVTQKDIFSRCQICNGNQYAYIKQHEMKAAWLRRQTDDTNTTERFHCPLNELKSSGQIDFKTLTINSGKVPLQLDHVPEPVINNIDLFFCCLTCGKVYWEGSHFARVCEQFSHVLKT